MPTITPADQRDINREAVEARQYLPPELQAELDALLWNPERERKRYRHDPVAFAREVLGMDLAPYQERALWALHDHKRVAFRGPRGAGKSTIGAACVLWFLTVFDECKVPTTASSWNQLKSFLWPEIHKWAVRAQWWRVGMVVRPGRELLARELNIHPDKNRSAFAMASSNEAKVEGGHSPAMLLVFDESKEIPEPIWDSLEGSMGTSEDAYELALSTPGDNVGRFFEIFKKRDKFAHWEPVVATLDECVEAGRITKRWVNDMTTQWGTDSVVYKRHVLGEFAEDTGDTLITMGMVERAQNIWLDKMQKLKEYIEDGMSPFEAEQAVWGSLTHIGIDPAREGDDKTGWAFRYGSAVKKVDRTAKEDTAETADRARDYMQNNTALAHIDVNGLGAGVFDGLRKMWREKRLRKPHDKKLPLVPINVSNGTKARDKSGELSFMRLRDYLYWHMRELLETGETALPPDDELLADLIAPRWKLTAAGKIVIEEKKEIKKRLGRSPDTGEAVIYVFAPDALPYKPQIGFF